MDRTVIDEDEKGPTVVSFTEAPSEEWEPAFYNEGRDVIIAPSLSDEETKSRFGFAATTALPPYLRLPPRLPPESPLPQFAVPPLLPDGPVVRFLANVHLLPRPLREAREAAIARSEALSQD